MVNIPNGIRPSFDDSELEALRQQLEAAKETKREGLAERASAQDKNLAGLQEAQAAENLEIETLNLNEIAEPLDIFVPLMADENIENLFIPANKDQKDKTEVFYNFKTCEARPVEGKKLAQKLAEDPSYTFNVQDRNKTTSTPKSLGALVTEREANELWKNYELVLIQEAAKSRQGAEDTLKEAKKQEEILEADMKRDQQNIENANRKAAEHNEERRDAHLRDAKLLNEFNLKHTPLRARFTTEDSNQDQKIYVQERSASKKLRKKQQDTSEQVAKNALRKVESDEVLQASINDGAKISQPNLQKRQWSQENVNSNYIPSEVVENKNTPKKI